MYVHTCDWMVDFPRQFSNHDPFTENIYTYISAQPQVYCVMCIRHLRHKLGVHTFIKYIKANYTNDNNFP